ncbi:hypothetical protein AAC387_Pa03g3050 [Persea americana]|eukprot:TRINITY_DN2637_c0_g1_i1.p1 TRINITY_DN2637_c0_g1~~TRINITY_DN2637_c0_g1_i1.p1  ORF type:complete len:182 (-),score=29.43 TRINITY_DN2637_c0_g1_i1:310-855(-)
MASHHLLSFFFLFSLLQAHGDEIPTVGSTLSSSFPAALQALQKQIGYQFQTVDLLRRAMTHPSYSRDNNKLLSYLGLRTIQSTASLRLISRDPEMSPKDLDRRITEISREDACAVGATRLGLEKVVRVSAKTDVSAPVVLCGAFRAIFGAVAVDNGTVDAGGDVFWRVRGSGAGGVFLYDL